MTSTGYHQADPLPSVAAAMLKADINMYATPGAFADGECVRNKENIFEDLKGYIYEV
jgi:hypothetical protein